MSEFVHHELVSQSPASGQPRHLPDASKTPNIGIERIDHPKPTISCRSSQLQLLFLHFRPGMLDTIAHRLVRGPIAELMLRTAVSCDFARAAATLWRVCGLAEVAAGDEDVFDHGRLREMRKGCGVLEVLSMVVRIRLMRAVFWYLRVKAKPRKPTSCHEDYLNSTTRFYGTTNKILLEISDEYKHGLGGTLQRGLLE